MDIATLPEPKQTQEQKIAELRELTTLLANHASGAAAAPAKVRVPKPDPDADISSDPAATAAVLSKLHVIAWKDDVSGQELFLRENEFRDYLRIALALMLDLHFDGMPTTRPSGRVVVECAVG